MKFLRDIGAMKGAAMPAAPVPGTPSDDTAGTGQN